MKYFFEIGSNSYDTLTSLAKNGDWTGVLIEPVKKYFDQIERVNNCFYENIAITENGGKHKFYYYDHFTATGWGTLQKDHLKKLHHLSSEEPICIEVESMTINQLFEKYNFPKIDYLKIDVESYDAKIVKAIDFKRFKIDKIEFEYVHLTSKELVQTMKILNANNFGSLNFTEDNLIAQTKV